MHRLSRVENALINPRTNALHERDTWHVSPNPKLAASNDAVPSARPRTKFESQSRSHFQ